MVEATLEECIEAGTQLPRSVDIIGSPICPLTWRQALDTLAAWSAQRRSRYVCICNVHSVVTARFDPVFREVLANCDMATPDGAPLAWFLRKRGHPSQERINGPDLMLRYFAEAADRGEKIYLYGGRPEILVSLRIRLQERFPGLIIAGHYSPPFRPLTPEEDAAVVREINASGAGSVWVSLGCPKQEKWMARQAGRINAVMVGVGAAFDYHAGAVTRAPPWMQRYGLEWLHRLASDPRRLWRRYLVTNTLFIYYACAQLLGVGKTGKSH